MTSAIIHRIIVVLNLPEHVPDQLKQGEAVSAALVSNPNFPLPDSIITAFNDALTKYSAAATAAQTRAKGTIAARNAAMVVYVGALHALKGRIQQVADANPENAEAIITSTTQVLAAKYGATSGTIHVTAPAAGARASYEWQYSIDGGKTWVQAPNTLQAKTTITGLPVATVVQFRVRVTTKTGMGDWSLPTSILVK